MESNKALNINSLPEEVLINIFSYLSQNKLGQIARVCQRWNALTKSQALWKKVNVIFCHSRESQTEAFKNFVSLLPPLVSCIRIDFRNRDAWIEYLYFEDISVALRERCPHLEMLLLKDVTIPESLPSVLKLCINFLQDLKILIFIRSRFIWCPKEVFDNDSKIEVLHLYDCYTKYLEKPPLPRMPNLKQLRLSGTDIGDSSLEDDISYLNQLDILDVGHTHVGFRGFRAIKNHGLNVKELYFCHRYIKEKDLNFNNTVFPYLKTICIRGCYPVTCKGIVSLVQSCQSLQNVYVTQEMAALYAAHPFTKTNKCKLEIVKGIDICVTYPSYVV